MRYPRNPQKPQTTVENTREPPKKSLFARCVDSSGKGQIARFFCHMHWILGSFVAFLGQPPVIGKAVLEQVLNARGRAIPMS